MKKIIVISSLLVMFVFLVSCAPQITDEELEAELSKLTPEQREELVKDLENEKGAFAGKAVAMKVSPKMVGVPKNKILDILEKCTDSDGGVYSNVTGTTHYSFALNSVGDKIKLNSVFDDGTDVDECGIEYVGEFKTKPIVAERYCDVANNVNATIIIGCQYGCKDGACLQPPKDLQSPKNVVQTK